MRSKTIQQTSRNQVSATVPVADIRRALNSDKRILVASHVDPDGDAIGTQLAFAEYLHSLGKDVFSVRETEVPSKYRFLSGAGDMSDVSSFGEDFRASTALVLECPNIGRIGKVRQLLTADATVINIDHHQDNEQFGNVNWVDTKASSVGEMAFEYFRAVAFPISPSMAEHLYTAILTDTGRFRYSSTSSRTMTVTGELIEAGADPQKICDNVYYNLRPSTMKLIGKVLNSIEFLDNGTICLLTLTREMLDQTGAELSESDGLVDFALFTEGVIAGALLKENDSGGTKVSLRSRNKVNVAALAARCGGGGHPNASGCTLPLSLPEAKEKMISLLREAIHARQAR